MVKLYYPELESDRVSAWVKAQDNPLLYSRLHELELRNALALKEFRGELDADGKAEIARTLADDLRTGVLTQPVLDWETVFSEAVRLSGTHTAGIGSRSLDLLHVAAAVVSGCRSFLSFDERQRTLAVAAAFELVEIMP
jgi:predicted nucleic acid-binding protein